MAAEPPPTEAATHAGPLTAAARRRAHSHPLYLDDEEPIYLDDDPFFAETDAAELDDEPADLDHEPADLGNELNELEEDAGDADVYQWHPHPSERRIAALVALGVIGFAALFQIPLLFSDSTVAGSGGLSATASLGTVAPGGQIALRGRGAKPEGEVILETRTPGGDWRDAGTARADDDGRFDVKARIAARPGKVDVRARAAGGDATAPVTVPVRPLTLAAVGDINLGDAPGSAIAASGPSYPWTSVGASLRKADIAFGNLECAISERGAAFPKKYNFRGTPEALAGLKAHSGIDVLNLANNHVGDFGPSATLDTVREVRKLGMTAVGAGANLDGAGEPQVVERLGLKVAFVGFSNILPYDFAATADHPGVAWATTEAVTNGVREARSRADIVVATFHWGIEKMPYETADQHALAQAAADAGAQLVIGAHPHVLQPVRRSGATVVAYSLGNFVFGAHSAGTSTTGILETSLTAEGISGARWRGAQISGGRPQLDDQPPRKLPIDEPEASTAGLTL